MNIRKVLAGTSLLGAAVYSSEAITSIAIAGGIFCGFPIAAISGTFVTVMLLSQDMRKKEQRACVKLGLLTFGIGVAYYTLSSIAMQHSKILPETKVQSIDQVARTSIKFCCGVSVLLGAPIGAVIRLCRKV